MRIKSLAVKNFRSLEDFSVEFSSIYSVICGKNNSGKSSIIRAIDYLLGDRRELYLGEDTELGWKENVTLWNKDKSPAIVLSLTIEAKRHTDPAFLEFVERITSLKLGEAAKLTLTSTITPDDKTAFEVSIEHAKKKVDNFAAQEIRKWISERGYIIVHDSTNATSRRYYRYSIDVFSFSKDENEEIAKINKSFTRLIKRVSKAKKAEFEDLLGSVGEKYAVQFEMPRVDYSQLPYSISLAEQKGREVQLDNWGSGTKNRTQIFSCLIRAKQIAAEPDITKKITPVVLVEEPEAFLHPSAQSNFGRVLEELAADLGIQIIASSHSPFLLSRSNTGSNFLVERTIRYGKSQETGLTPTSAGDLAPFAFALGMNVEELGPWRDVLLSGAGCVLVVEGSTDREVLEAILKRDHRQISERISIKEIGGKDKLRDRGLIQFIHKFVGKVVFMLDLDAKPDVESKLKDAGLTEDNDYLFVGRDAPGKRRLEGCYPDSVLKHVVDRNIELVERMQSDKPEEKKSAISSFKTAMAAEILVRIDAGEQCEELDKVAKKIGRAFSGS